MFNEMNQLAMKHIRNGDYDNAYRLLKENAEKSYDYKSLHNLAVLHYQYFGEADSGYVEKLLLKALSLKSNYESLSLLGLLYYRNENYIAARNMWYLAVKEHKSSVSSYNLSIAEYMIGHYHEAYTVSKECQQQANGDLYESVLLLHAAVFIKIGELNRAKELIDKLIDLYENAYNDAIFGLPYVFLLACGYYQYILTRCSIDRKKVAFSQSDIECILISLKKSGKEKEAPDFICNYRSELLEYYDNADELINRLDSAIKYVETCEDLPFSFIPDPVAECLLFS